VRDGGVSTSSFGDDGASSGGALALGNLTTVAVDLGEAPPVITLARQASGGLGDSGSKARVAAQFFLCGQNDRRGRCLYRGKHPA
jgi:hypothetical protein